MYSYQSFLDYAQDVEEAADVLKQRIVEFYHFALVFFDDKQINELSRRAQKLGDKTDLTAELVEIRQHLSLTGPEPDLIGMIQWVHTMELPYLLYTLEAKRDREGGDALTAAGFVRGCAWLGRQVMADG